MKRCPECRRDYVDDTLLYCLEDGAALVQGSVALSDEPKTAILHQTGALREAATQAQIHMTDRTAVLQPAIPESAKPRSFDKRLLLAPVALALIVLAAFFGYRYSNASDTDTIDSIAVLPFDNRSNDPDTDYLSDGLAESLIFRLTQLPKLKVSPTSSVMRYKGKETDTVKIAGELGVEAVMTGRIVKRGENLNITVELVDVRNNKSIWGEQYERKMSELLATQREIATEITQKLKLKLSGTDEQKFAKKYTDNDEAYQLYLRGQYHLARRSKDDLQKAIEYYEQAIRLDPNFALAYVGISYAYNTGTGNNFFPVSREEGYARARTAAVRARDIDPNLADAHAALGLAFRAEWKWSEAENAFKRALEIDPNNANVHYYYGLFLQSTGRTGESIREIKAAVEMEPLSLIMNANLAGAYMFDGQNEMALDHAKKTFDLDPNFISGRFWLAYALCANKKYDETIELVNGAAKDQTTRRLLSRFLGYAYAKSGRRSEAEALLAVYKSDVAFTGFSEAITYAALGERDKAFAALEKEFIGKGDFSRIKVDPLVADLRDDPRFADLIKRMNLPQ
jgi:eukaryotic-like serine/threonine-protein kinase